MTTASSTSFSAGSSYPHASPSAFPSYQPQPFYAQVPIPVGEGDNGALSAAVREADAAVQRIAQQDGPAQANIAEDVERAWTWLSHTFQGLQRFIVDQPLLAIVVAVACAFFGISRILPLGDLIGGVLSAAFTGLVIYTARTEPTRTQFFDHLRHDALHGVGASAARNQGRPLPVRA